MNRKPVVLAMKVGNIGEPTTLCSVLPLPAELGVLLFDQQAEVGGEQPDQDERHDQHVEDEEPRDDHPVARVVATEEEEGQVGARPAGSTR